jgi:hypothetical protein
MRGC